MPYYKVVLKNNAGNKPLEMRVEETHEIYLYKFDTECPEIFISSLSEICTGTTMEVTSFIVNNVAATVYYEWFLNDVNTYWTGDTYTFMPTNGDTLYCTLTSGITSQGITCGVRTSNVITYTVNEYVTPNITISVETILGNPPTVLCSGVPLVFSSIKSNGCLNPTFQWKKTVDGTTTNIPNATGDTMFYIPQGDEEINCYMTSSCMCVEPSGVTSNAISLTGYSINESVTPSVSIRQNPSGTICSGTSITFIAEGTNGGSSPGYKWKVNGTEVGSLSAYTYIPNNGDLINITYTSSNECAYPNPVYNEVTANVYDYTTVSLTIGSTPAAVGTTITIPNSTTDISFYKDTSAGDCSLNGDPNIYTWYLYSGTTEYFIKSGLTWDKLDSNDGDIVYAKIKSNCSCISGSSTVESTHFTINILEETRSASISGNTNICSGSTQNYTCSTIGLNNPITYAWYINNIFKLSGQSFTWSGFTNNDAVKCIATDSTGPVTSNILTITVRPNNTVDFKIAYENQSYAAIYASGCTGSQMYFHTTGETNAGTNTIYQWQIYSGGTWWNYGTAGGNNTLYISTLQNNNQIRCLLYSNVDCPSAYPAISNVITAVMFTPSVSISAPTNCYTVGLPITFTATPTDGGTSPQYEWHNPPDGDPYPTGSTWTTTFTASGGHTVYCMMTPSGGTPCSNAVQSNSISLINCSYPTNFGSGFNGEVLDIEFGTQDGIYVGGDFTTYSGISANCIIKLQQSGQKDSTFNYGSGFGWYGLDVILRGLKIQNVNGQDRVYTIGYYASYNNVSGLPAQCVSRLSQTGVLDTNFWVSQQAVSGGLKDIEIGPNEEIYLYGGQQIWVRPGNVEKNCIVKLNDNGSFVGDTGWHYDVGGNNYGPILENFNGSRVVNSIEIDIDDNDSMFIAGNFSYLDSTQINQFGVGTRTWRIVKINSDGTLNNTFNVGSNWGFSPNVYGSWIELVKQIKLVNMGGVKKLYCVGSFTKYLTSVAEFPSEYIIRLNLDGTVDKAYGNQFDSIGTTQGVNSIAIEYSGDTHYCYLVGQFTKYSGINSKNIVKIDEDGNIVTTFNVGGGLMGTNAKANVVKIHADGNIWVGGYFTSYHEATTYRNMIVKIKPNGDVYPSS